MNGGCHYVYDGSDFDGTDWYRCVTHDQLEVSNQAPCGQYEESEYSPDED